MYFQSWESNPEFVTLNLPGVLLWTLCCASKYLQLYNILQFVFTYTQTTHILIEGNECHNYQYNYNKICGHSSYYFGKHI